MTVLLDTDVLIDVALDRKPFSEHSSQVLDASERRIFQAFLAWHSVANFYYLVASGRNKQRAKAFIVELLNFVEIAPTSTDAARHATTLEVTDFEDALQIVAAQACNAERIVTRNTKHYLKSPIPAISPSQLLDQLDLSASGPI